MSLGLPAEPAVQSGDLPEGRGSPRHDTRNFSEGNNDERGVPVHVARSFIAVKTHGPLLVEKRI